MPLLDPMTDLITLYSPRAGRPELVDVPDMQYLMVEGADDPDKSPAFRHAIEGLYGVAYTRKYTRKKDRALPDFKVAPIEGLFWSTDAVRLIPERSDEWCWTLMLALPDFVGASDVASALDALRKKRGADAACGLRCERFHEGPAAQILHVGPYAAEPPTIERLHAFIRESGRAPSGRHHEIYLSDPRRCAPERLRTIIRQPIQ